MRLREHQLPNPRKGRSPVRRPIADFVFGDADTLSGIFVHEKDGTLSGLEVYGLAGDAPKSLPQPQELRPFGNLKAEKVG